MHSSHKSSFIKIVFLSLILLLTGFGCKKTQQIEDVDIIELSYWQVWQNSFDLEPLIKKYEQLYPQVRINFRNLRFEEYEQEILKALAEDKGPDIFSIPHDWVGLYKNIIAPQPDRVSIKQVILKEPGPGDLEPTIQDVYTKNELLLTPRDIKRRYYPFVRNDVLRTVALPQSAETGGSPLNEQERIMALPLYIDTLALYYNRDILENNDIYNPPTDWESFQKDVMQIVQVDSNNNIIQAAAALGTTENITRPTDILVALMIQTGVDMIDQEQGFAKFHQTNRQDNYNAGLESLRFYTDFADVTKRVYTWNSQQPQALELFRQGKLAYYFGYAYNLEAIQGSKVNFGVAPLPNPKDAISNISIANYWVETVSKKSKNIAWAWHFLNFLSVPENLLQLQTTTNSISPLREHINSLNDPILTVFANQALTSRVWYQGADAPAAEQALKDMIDSVVSGDRSLESALSFGAQNVTQTLK